MSQFEIDIIQKLSARAAEPTEEFSRLLRKQLLDKEHELKTNVIPERKNIMNIKKLTFGLVGLAVLAGAVTFAVLNQQKTDQSDQTAQTQPLDTSTTQASSLPSQQAQNLEEAKKSLTFAPLLPTKRLSSETLTDIKVGTKNFMIDDSDTIYLTYADSQGTLFKMSQSTKVFSYPTDAEKVYIQVGGEEIIANYYRLGEVESGNVNSSGEEPSSPASYIFWSADGVNYEISEFGRVSKQQLIELASSLQ